MRPELVVSKQKLRQAEGSCMVRLKREEGKQNVGFRSRPFVLCGLPVRKPPAGEMLYERRNGDFVLQITGHPNYGLPFGQDRIVPIYLATLAVRQQSQTIRFRTAAEMMETFGMHKGGKEYRRLASRSRSMIARSSSSFFSSAITVGDAFVNLRFSCRCRFSGAFMRIPLAECIQQRLIALSSIAGQGVQNIAKLVQCLNRDQRIANDELEARRVKHPCREPTGCLIWQSDMKVILRLDSVTTMHANTLPKQRVPAVIDRHTLKIVCIM